jgi:hypothetical protein
LVYLLIYDARHDMFRAMGISGSDGLFNRWLANGRELENLMGCHPEDDSLIPLRAVLGQFYPLAPPNADSEPLTEEHRKILKPFVHRILEHSIIARLRPRGASTRSRGISWTLLTGDTKRYFWERTEDYPELFDLSGRYYCPSLYARPFATDRAARADGVLWVGWCQQPQGFAVLSDNRIADAAMEDHIQTIQEVIAAIFALYQYYDPDDAYRPLPFRPPASGG